MLHYNIHKYIQHHDTTITITITTYYLLLSILRVRKKYTIYTKRIVTV